MTVSGCLEREQTRTVIPVYLYRRANPLAAHVFKVLSDAERRGLAEK